MQLPKLLLIDDDSNIARALALALRNNYTVDLVTNGEDALYQIEEREYAIIILDLNLPDVPGLVICQQLRMRGVISPVLVLSGESQSLTKINLLDAGANDYLTKPFSLGELKARLRALQRTSATAGLHPRLLKVNGYRLDRQAHMFYRDGKSFHLRRKEFALLECLMEHAGSVVTRASLTRHAWQDMEDPWTNTVDVHIKYLRTKIDAPFDEPLIQTVYGMGYRFRLLQPVVHEEKS